MTNSGFKVLDSDMHIIEPADLWQRYIDPAFKDRAPKGMARWPRDLVIELEGRALPRPYPNPKWSEVQSQFSEAQQPLYQESEDRDWDGVSQLMGMDREGVDAAVLFPTSGLFVLARDGLDPELAAAISRGYNDWLHDFCKAGSGRLYGAGMIPPHNVEAAIAEARRCVGEMGFKAVFMRPNRVNGRNLHDPYYDPLWAELESLGIPVGFHEGGQYLDIPHVGSEFETYMMNNTCTHSIGMILATISLIGGGILERFPKLRVGLLEGNCSWAPWLLWRMDEHYDYKGKHERPDLKLRPTEYFKRQCYVSVECDEEPAKYAVDWGLEDNLVFSTDYPHGDSKFPRSVERFMDLPLTEGAKRKILWDNCARLYDLGNSP